MTITAGADTTLTFRYNINNDGIAIETIKFLRDGLGFVQTELDFGYCVLTSPSDWEVWDDERDYLKVLLYECFMRKVQIDYA